MKRISTQMPNDDMQYQARMREWRMSELQNRMAGQTRIKELRDDPIAAAHSTRYTSKIQRLTRFTRNIDTLRGDLRIAEGYMSSANDIVQRVREIAVQGANGVYTPEERAYMAEEVNELLNELVEIGNAVDGEGSALFAGDKTEGQAFRVLTGSVPWTDKQVITSVDYLGTANSGKVEIAEGSYVDQLLQGNRVFWAEHQQVYSQRDAQAFQVQEDSFILVDGMEISLKSGDSVHSVIAKINESGAAVKASLDPVRNSLVLTTTVPHQLMLEDRGDGRVLKDLGILAENGRPPLNYHRDARVSGGSVFDMMMNLRDSLYSGDTLQIGGGALKGLDLAHHTLLSSIAGLGALDERMQTVEKRLLYEIPELKEKNSKETDIDLAEAITDLKMLEYTHKAALQTAARVLQPTLMDYLR
ncbi:MAG: flagellar hook-associated protein 3 [Spirochaetales bacterium]|nr:flagellar hook-associated protein 3 [Spirochaetales bacterium]